MSVRLVDKRRWVPIDHACRECGGRILQCVAGSGPTGGGNPVFMCADCEMSGANMGPDHLCWCGNRYRGAADYSDLLCVRLSDAANDEPLRIALAASGYDTKTSKIAIGCVNMSYRKLVEDRLDINSSGIERDK